MMKIKIPLPQKISINTFVNYHWAKRGKIIALYHNALVESRNKRITRFPVELTYRFTYKKKPLDTDNTAFSAKLLTDSMVLYGILPNDSPQFVSALHLYSKKGARDEVEIEIV